MADKDTIDRRQFITTTAAGAAALSLGAASSHANDKANAKLVVGVMGMGGRGTTLAKEFARQADTQVKYVCDVDANRVASAAKTVGKEQAEAGDPQAIGDFRRILDDKDVDILVIATCDHWHAPAAIMGCSAAKHVYVEKPCSHNAQEGEWLVQAARKNKRVVQMGNQRRSWPKVMEGIALVRDGGIGNVYYARCWYANGRGPTGKRTPAAKPDWLDWDLWQGPAPRVDFADNIVHYKWHWYWEWGTGEIGNNGVHAIDVARWGLGVDYPTHVSSGGGRYVYDDDQHSPDTHVVSYQFPGEKMIAWEGLSCTKFGVERTGFGITFHGDKGTVLITGAGYTVFDSNNKELKKESGPGGNDTHVADFLAGIRTGSTPNSEIEEGHKSTLLCHLGNIAHRVGRSLTCNPGNGHIVGDDDAMKLWGRDYAEGWEPKV